MQQQTLPEEQAVPLRHEVPLQETLQQAQRPVYRYQPPQRPMKLLALAWYLTAVALMIGGFFNGQEPLPIWGMLVPAPFSTLLQWAGGLFCLAFGWMSGKQARDLKGKQFQLAFLEDTIVMLDPASPGSEHELFRVSKVDRFRVVETKKGRRLEVWLTTGLSSNGTNSTAFASEDMGSLEEFDAFVAHLREKLPPEKERR